MRTFDPTPLWRSTIGFDRLVDMLDQSSHFQANDSTRPTTSNVPAKDFAGARRIQSR